MASDARTDAPVTESPAREVAANAVLWLAVLLSLLAFRGFLIFWFRAKLSPQAHGVPLFRCFGTGLRADVCVATYAVLPSLVVALGAFLFPPSPWPARVRRMTAAVVLAACALVFVTDAAYFAQYGDQFNDWIFGLVYDDRGAIFSTIWKTYPVGELVLVTIAGAAAAIAGVERMTRALTTGFRPSARRDRGWVRAMGVASVVILALLGLRGSLGRRPLQPKDLATTGDAFLNSLVPNPFFALYVAVRDERRLQTESGVRSFLPDGDVKGAARALFPVQRDPADLDSSLERVAHGGVQPGPSHIFLVVMESYDSWSMQPKFASLHLTDRMAALGRDGISVRAFVPAGSGTIKSLGAIITGLPAAGLFVNHQPALRGGVPTSAPRIFHRLGYRTRFFYGGYLSWERIGDFAREQGFDEVYGGDRMSARLTGNEWGVDDDVLFSFILEHTADEPTFDVVMSSSYHPPFSVDVEAKGFDLEALRGSPLGHGLTTGQLRILGHLWYADKSLADFVTAAEQRLARPLFALTGDHYSREESVNPRPSLFESTAVPFVLHGRGLLGGAPRSASIAGAHVDIVPTLVELVAPKGFPYHAFGRDLLDPSQPQFGYGDESVIAPGFIFRLRDPEHVEDLDGRRVTPPAEAAELVRRYRQLHALAWWRTRNGAAWPP